MTLIQCSANKNHSWQHTLSFPHLSLRLTFSFQDVSGAAASDPSKKDSMAAGLLGASNVPPDRSNAGQREVS